MPPRKSSRGQDEHDMSLEQRLVMQLSAAIRHEDSQGDDESSVNIPQKSTDKPRHDDTLPDNVDVANLVRSLGETFGPMQTQPQTQARTQPESVLSSAQNTGLRVPGSNETGASDSITPSLGNAALPSSLGAALGNLSNSNLSLSDMGSLLRPSESSRTQHTAQPAGPAAGTPRPDASDLSSLSLGSYNLEALGNLDTLLATRALSNASSSTLAHTPAGLGQDLQAQQAQQAQQVQPQQTPSHESHDFHMGIDPDVSSIHSVLQSLLSAPAAQSKALAAGESTQAPSAASTSVVSDQPSASSSDQSSLGVPDLTSLLGLGAEDQSLVESLRSAMNQASATSQDASTSLNSLAGPKPTSVTTLAPRTRATQPKPRRSRAGTPQTSAASTTFREQSDFSTSDPDTLRAIQQALLSALGPSASATSLAESLTSETRPWSTGAPGGTSSASTEKAVNDAILGKSSSKTSAQAAANAATAVAGSLAEHTAPILQAQRTISPSGPILPGRIPEPRVTKALQGKPAAISVKPASRPATPSLEPGKQKTREGNAARKRKWRVENVTQNKDIDLRARIIRRAQTIYGDEDSEKKQLWIESEFQRRRQKRILRADINNVVANAIETAKAKATQAVEDGKNPLQFARDQIADKARTLTRQSRHVASSQLSQLFRKSNAALEPQLHSEKVPLPLAPYLLVPSPDRPPFKLPQRAETWKKNDEEGQESVALGAGESKNPETTRNSTETGHDAQGPTAPAGSPHLQAPKSAGPAPKDSEPRNVTEDSDRMEVDEMPNLDAKGKTGDGETLPSSKEDKDPENPKAPEEGPGASDDLDKPAAASSGSSPFAPRPKHRYSLVGRVRLGAPPNIAAIYHKIHAMQQS